MNGYQNSDDRFDRLRRQAEALIEQSEQFEDVPTGGMLELIHELKINQAELQIQNEELKAAQQEISELHREAERLYEFAPCGYVTLDARGIITRVNLTGVRLLGVARKFLLHSGLSRYIDDAWQDSYIAALKSAAQSGDNQTVELRLRKDDGQATWVLMQIESESDEAGRTLAWRVTFGDVSLQKAMETALLANERRHKALFSNMVSGAAILEISKRNQKGRILDLRFVDVNPAFESLTGCSGQQVIGKSVREIWPKTRLFWFQQVDKALARGQSRQVEGFHEELGKHFLLSAFQLDDRIIAVTFVDISAQVKIQEGLKEKGNELAVRLDQKTTDLHQSGQQLSREMDAHKLTKTELLEMTWQLKERQAKLEEANAALKVLLRTHESERREWEEKVVSNIETQTKPFLARLAAASLSQNQQKLVKAVDESLEYILSPLSRRMVIENIKLTPSEVHVARLIRQGKSTKEISAVLGVATSTIDYHRNNIRKKLNLTHHGTNLQSYLQSFE